MRVIKSRNVRWTGNVVRKRQMKKGLKFGWGNWRDLLEDLTADRTERSLKRNIEGACPQSPDGSRPILFSKTWQRLFGFLIMATYGNAYKPAESNRVDSSPTDVAESRVFITYVSFLTIGLQWSGVPAGILGKEIIVEHLIILFTDHQALYDVSRCQRRHRDYIASAR